MLRLRFTFALAALAGFSVLAQSGPGEIQITDKRFHGAAFGFHGNVVKAAPYSAQAVSETTQVLADGNRISRKTVTNVARDSEGRTRREETVASTGPWSTDGQARTMVFINDPVAQVNYVLDTSRRTANKMSTSRMRRPAREENGHQMDTARMQKLEAEKQAMQKERANSKTESLGTQVIGGVTATGTRHTRTIPAGKIGNDRAIDIVSETWYSPDLQVVVMSKHSDPRSGETIYTLNNIQRNEPDVSLFSVPADYAVQENSNLKFVRKLDR